MKAVFCVCFFALLFVAVEGESFHNVKLQKHVFPSLEHVPNFLQSKLAKRSGDDFPLGGDIYPLGIYFLEIGMGTPPRKFKVALDTGSSDLLIPMTGCKGCHLQNTSSYDPTASKTSRKIGCDSEYFCASCIAQQCSFENTYETCNLTDPDQPCTVSGPIFKDFFTLSSQLTVTVAFGAIRRQTANFQQFYVIDGVMGFAGKGSSTFGESTPFERLVEARKLKEDIFSICLNTEKDYPASGTITLGGIDPSLHTGTVKYTPVTDAALYSVQMRNIKLNGRSVGVPWSYSTTTIIDSGTNTLLLNTPTFDALKSTFMKDCSSGAKWVGVCNEPNGQTLFDGKCFALTQADRDNFPTISLDLLDNVTLNITGRDYLLKEKNGLYCLGIDPTGDNGFTIIGDVVMKEYYFVFDRANKRLGTAPVNRANCLAQSS